MKKEYEGILQEKNNSVLELVDIFMDLDKMKPYLEISPDKEIEEYSQKHFGISIKDKEELQSFYISLENRIAERVDHESPVKSKEEKTSNFAVVDYPDLPLESFIFSYDGPHKDYFQELIAKSNEKFKGTRAKIREGKRGEVKKMYMVRRMALVSTIVANPNLMNYDLLPITPMQSECLLKEGKLPHRKKYWEDLALLLYDTNGENQKEAQVLKEDIIRHKSDLDLSQSDLESRLVIVGAGAELDKNMRSGVRPIIIPGITLVYPHEILNRTEKSHIFDYGLDRGLPAVSEIGRGERDLIMPRGDNIGLRVLFNDRNLVLGAWCMVLAPPYGCGRTNFVLQKHAS